MSQWRLAVKALHELGGEAFMPPGYGDRNSGLYIAKRMGLITGGYHHNGSRVKAMWKLTELGWRWCEGRVTLAPAPHIGSGRPGYRFVATWLDAVPRGVTIDQTCFVFCAKCREKVA